MMSRTSPLGPYDVPAHDLVSTTCVERGVFGPGHGCVFNDGDDYYFAFLEFGRNSTNRQTYVNKLEFNNNGTIKPVQVTLDGVGALRKTQSGKPLKPVAVTASSVREPMKIRYFNDKRCQRTEHFVPAFAVDGKNGSRWMGERDESGETRDERGERRVERKETAWLMMDLGRERMIRQSELSFVRPTAGHAYVLEGSHNGQSWEVCGGHADVQKRSPHVDKPGRKYRYLRVTIKEGVCGVWEWRVM